jgi:phage terminase large subunit-like protein
MQTPPGLRYFVNPRFVDTTLTPVGDWLPARYTPSLSGTEDFPSDADRLLEIVAEHWRSPEVERFLLDPWQVWLLRHILEVYPDDWPVEHLRGQLRFRQVVVSVARQNGKSILAAMLAFYFLTMHKRGPRVIGLASRDDQAKIVYDRVRYAIENNPALKRELNPTASRGIKHRNGAGIYQTLPAREESAQGEPVTGGIYDELHLGLAALWDAIVLGQRAHRNSMLCGFTTAGDADSALLLRLYDEGAAALEGDDERFGFFVWEAASDEVTAANLIAASPAIACGRVDLDTALADALKMWKAPKDPKTGVTGRDRCIRYILNRFVEGSATSWASLPAWKDGAATDHLEHNSTGRIFTVERTDAWEWASITATSRNPDTAALVTELVASIPAADVPLLTDLCKTLDRAHPGSAFGVDRTTLADLGKALTEEGLEVWSLTAGEMAHGAAATRSAIARRNITHPGDRLLTMQMGQAKRRDLGDSWRISRSKSVGDIDTVIGLVAGVYIAQNRTEQSMQLF